MILLEDTKQIGFFLTFIEKAIHGIFNWPTPSGLIINNYDWTTSTIDHPLGLVWTRGAQ